MKCLFLGPLITHAVPGRITALDKAGFKVDAVNVFDKYIINEVYHTENANFINDLYKKDNYYDFSRKEYFKELFRIINIKNEDTIVISELKNILHNSKPDFIVLSYGPISLHYARIIRKISQKIPVFIILNLFPNSLNPVLWKPMSVIAYYKEIFELKFIAKNISGFFTCSTEMNEYLSQNFNISDDKMKIIPDYLPFEWFVKDFQEEGNWSRESGENHLIYLGSPKRIGGVIDSLDEEFRNISKQNIHIHSGNLSEEIVKSGYGHIYKSFSNAEIFSGKFAQFAHNADAALILYNAKISEKRFKTTLPTRFFTSLSAGLPLVAKEGILDSVNSFILDREVGFVYKDMYDLKKKLKDRVYMEYLRLNVKTNLKKYSAETQGDELRKFILGNTIT